MDEDAIRRELEYSGDDNYLCDLDEEFRDLSSEEDNGVNQVSRAEPSYKKARISVRTLSVDSEDSEEEIGVERTERHVIKSDSDSETNVAFGGGSGCAGDDGGESVSIFWQTLPPAMSAPSSPTTAKSPQRASSNQTFLLHPKLFFNFSIISDRHGLTSAVTTFLLTDFIQAQHLPVN